MKTDTQLQSDVIAELKWDDAINASKIGVQVDGGVVTLSGHVDSFSQKWSAERAVQKVSGVKALAIDIDVELQGSSKKSDTDIARTAKNVLEWTANWPENKAHVMVENGWVTLTGELDFEYQREFAFNAIRHLMGVTGVSNKTTVKSFFITSNIKADIEAALKRRSITDTNEIMVTVDGGKVTLNGVVQSWSERDMVSDSVWHTTGVTAVNNHISIAY